MPLPRIRAGRLEDAAHLPAIERAAGEAFRAIPDLAWIADHDVLDADDHRDAIAAGAHWVAEFDGTLAGFLMGEMCGDDFHIRELSVDPRFQGRGLGRALVRVACLQAQVAGATRATLTTFRDVAWNEPLYHRLGFVTLDDAGIDPRLRAILDHEHEMGLPRRCAMARPLADPVGD